MAAHSISLMPRKAISKSPTGITGLDQITEGGLPKGRPTLICGSAGCGKTVLAMEFLVRGATEFSEPGVFMAFEETEKELSQNVASMGFDLHALCAHRKLRIDYVRVERSEIEETGDYDLEGLFVRLDSAIKAVGAKRVVLDTIETLFSSFSNTTILRAELRRLFRWLKSKGVTALITAETGNGTLTRHGLEEYVADCVIFLDHRIEEQNAIRRMRVIKYRGSSHGVDEYPFLIGRSGLSVLPLSGLRLEYKAPTQRISSGIPELDAMMGGKGFLRGMSILLSGTAGSGKSSLAAHFVQAACRRGERALYMASEQSTDEVIRNMRSIGIDLEPWVKQGRLQFYSARPGSYGLERHLIITQEVTTAFDPKVVVVDPFSNFASAGSSAEVTSMLTRLIDLFKTRQITAMFTSLTEGDSAPEMSEMGVSSLMDAWILLRHLERNGERTRGLYLLKARGIAHSNQIREFELTDEGVRILDVCMGSSGPVIGSVRERQEAEVDRASQLRFEELDRKQSELKAKRHQMEAEIATMRAQFQSDEREVSRALEEAKRKQRLLPDDHLRAGNGRRATRAAA